MSGNQSRKLNKPAITGPFRGLIILFENTFQHPNHYYSEVEKRKVVIYYKNPYDVATIIEKHEHNTNFKISILNDKYSSTLSPDILYITSKPNAKLIRQINQLNGRIIEKTRIGVLVQFQNFKSAAIAMEEMRRDFKIRFAYKTNKVFDQREESSFKRSEVEIDVLKLFQKHKGCTAELEYDFRKALNIAKQENVHQKITKTSEKLELVNISRVDSSSDLSSQENENWNIAASSEFMLELHKKYKELKGSSQ